MAVNISKIEKWLTSDEEIEGFIEENLMSRHQVLVVTNQRAILFESAFGGRLKDKSDKLWRQLIAVHLNEGFFSSTLDIEFFQHHDSIVYHDPHDPNDTPLAPKWILKKLDKDLAREIYSNLKHKERIWKEKRRSEQLEQDKALSGKYLELRKKNN